MNKEIDYAEIILSMPLGLYAPTHIISKNIVQKLTLTLYFLKFGQKIEIETYQKINPMHKTVSRMDIAISNSLKSKISTFLKSLWYSIWGTVNRVEKYRSVENIHIYKKI